MEALEGPLAGDLALAAHRGGVGSQGLGGADQQRCRLRRRQAVSRTRPLGRAVGSGGVVDELGRSGGGGSRGAQGALAGGQRGSGGGGGGSWEVGGASDGAGAQLAGGGELPAQTGRLDHLRMSRG